MKRKFLTLILASTFFISFAQEAKPTKIYHNEFGIDATGFLRQFLNFNQQSFGNYYPTYYFTYRRYTKCGNLRFALGGDFASQDVQPNITPDSNKYHYNSYSYDARIGWEFVNELSTRWQVFYGLDFRPSFTYYKNDAQFWNSAYANGLETKSKVVAISPLLGFRFRISNRMSLMTESCFSVIWQLNSEKKYFTPVSSQYPAMPDIIMPKNTRVFSNFSQPLSIMIAFSI